ncbi:MAG: hypothetical protein KC619_01530 [Myxococcales bacterium]|nr:hypothetical protein [Myxococcales bacterium]
MAALSLDGHAERVQACRGGVREHLTSEAEALPDRFVAPEISTDVGDHQRFQLRVPTRADPVGTVLSAGRRRDGRNHDGFGLTTIAHVDVQTTGAQAESRMTFQSTGQAVVQSTLDSLYLLSSAPAVLASPSVSNVIGAGGVLITSGPAVPVPVIEVTDEAPVVAKVAESFADERGADVDAFAAVESFVDEAVAAHDQVQEDLVPDQKLELAAAKDESDFGSIADASFKAPNALGTAAEGSGGALGLRGQGGVLVHTPAIASIHADVLASVSSAAVALTGTDRVDLLSSASITATSGAHLGAYAAERMDLVSGTDKLHLATRSGPALEVQAKAIHLGATEPPSPQQPTTAVVQRSTAHASIGTGDQDPSADEAGIYLATHEKIDAVAASSITLHIDGQPIEVMIDQGKKVTVTVQDTVLEITASDGLVVKHGAAVLRGTKDDCYLGPTASNRVSMSSSGVVVKGSSIKLG